MIPFLLCTKPMPRAHFRTFRFVSAEYLETVGTPLVAGRKITWNDTYKKIPVAMVSENVARELWHDHAAALGKRIRVSTKDDWREIIGVVGDVYDDGVSKPATDRKSTRLNSSHQIISYPVFC